MAVLYFYSVLLLSMTLFLAVKLLYLILAAVVSSFTIFVDHDFIILRIIFLKYEFIIHCLFIGRILSMPNLNWSGVVTGGTKRKPVIRRLSQQKHPYLTC